MKRRQFLYQVPAVGALSIQGEDKTVFPDLQIAKWVMGLGHPLTEERTAGDATPLSAVLKKLADEGSQENLKLILDSFRLLRATQKYQSPLIKELTNLYS